MKRSWLVVALLLLALLVNVSLYAQERAAPSAVEIVTAMEKVVVDVIEKTQPSVVAIARVRNDAVDARDDGFDLRPGPFGQNFGREISDPTSPDFVPQEYGTGVVIDRAGLILTTYHVLSDPRKNDYYVWSQKRPFKATVIAADPWLDLAVLKIDAMDLTPIKFGDAKDLKKGQFVIALGNPYAIARDGEASATWGVISNTRRTPPATNKKANAGVGRESLHHYGNLLQTDARLERGTSGGALVNLQGEMIGLTTTLAPSTDAEGSAGFAFPIDQAFKDALEKLKTGRKVEYGFLGVGAGHLSLEERQRGLRGAKVGQVVGASPAAEAVVEGDVVTAVGDRPIEDANDLILELSKLPAGKQVELTLQRSVGERQDMARTLHKRVTLSKKYMDTARPVFASVVDPAWRGLTIDYSTAVPGFSGPRLAFVDPAGCVAVLDVDRNSVSWKAGLRPGMFISHVGKSRVAKPADFRDAVAKESGPVVLRLTEEIGESKVITIAP